VITTFTNFLTRTAFSLDRQQLQQQHQRRAQREVQEQQHHHQLKQLLPLYFWD
jgi:hypothetical protein